MLFVIVILLLSSGVFRVYSDISTKGTLIFSSYDEGIGIVNKSISFFEDYKSLAIIAGVVFSLLVVFIIILVIYLGKISRIKSELQESNEELTASGNKLKEQYDELTRIKQSLTSSENRYSMLFERMLNGFMVFEPITNNDGKFTDIRFLNVNPGFKLQTGISTEEIIGKTWTEVYKYPNKNLSIYHKVLHTGEPKHFETYYAQDNKYYLTNAFKISDNQVGAVFENITEYKKAIKKIAVLNEELEQRVTEKTEELQSAVNELEAFTYTVSHDLKSPLRAVDGYSRIILEDFRPRLGEEASEMIQNIRNICRDMIEMISKLLEYSTTSKAVMYNEEINFEVLFKSIFNELVSAHPDRDLKLNIETGLPIIFGDRVMIRQVVYNILSNAVKFTKHKEQALITVGCTITGEEYIFYLKDNGVGFDMEYARKLFGIFQRLHTSDEFEGSGIGLVTVKKIIHKHGGRVWIEGKTGVGAAVYFTLPMEW
ncbi:MAG: PAS domain-containing sensor histidine kinase [Clostridia bacterium]